MTINQEGHTNHETSSAQWARYRGPHRRSRHRRCTGRQRGDEPIQHELVRLQFDGHQFDIGYGLHGLHGLHRLHRLHRLRLNQGLPQHGLWVRLQIRLTSDRRTHGKSRFDLGVGRASRSFPVPRRVPALPGSPTWSGGDVSPGEGVGRHYCHADQVDPADEEGPGEGSVSVPALTHC
jgi:hypothetical protein